MERFRTGVVPVADGSGVQVFELDDQWVESTGDPRTLFSSDDPRVQAGTYVIAPGERVPEIGTTSHDGPELSVILSGEVVLGTDDKNERTVGPGTFVTISPGVEHYSENRTERSVKLVYVIAGDL